MADKVLTLQIRVDDKGSVVLEKVANKVGRVSSSAKKAQEPIRELNQRFRGLSSAAKIAAASLAGYLSVRALASTAKGFVSVASSVEQYEFRLRKLLGSQAAAAAKLEEFRKYASTVPHSLNEIIEAGTTLEAFGLNSSKWIKPLGDLAYVMGISLPEAAQALGRAYAGGAGAADIFRERGILNIIKSFKGIDDLTKLTLPQFRKAMYETFTDPAGKIAGAAKEAAGTWEGQLSMLGDAWYNLRQAVMRAGVFDYMKAGLEVVVDWLNRLKQEGKLDVWAKNTAHKVIVAFKVMAKGAVWFYKSILGLKGAFYLIKIAFTSFEKLLIKGLIKIVTLFSKIPKVGSKFKPVLEDLKLALDVVNESQQEAIEGLGNTADAIINVDETFDRLNKEIDDHVKQVQKAREENERLGKQTRKNVEDVVIPAYKKLLSTGVITLDKIKEAWKAASKEGIEQTAAVKEEFIKAYNRLLDTGKLRLKQVEAVWNDLERHNIEITDDVKKEFIKAYEGLFKTADMNLEQIKAAWKSMEKHNIQVTDNIKQATIKRFTEIVTSASTSLDQIEDIWDFMKKHNIQASDELKQATIKRFSEIVTSVKATAREINDIWDFMKEHSLSIPKEIRDAYIRANLDILRNANSTADQVREAWDRLQQMQLKAAEAFRAGWDYAYKNFQDKSQLIMNFGLQTAQNLRQSFSDTFFNAMTGKINKIGDVWKQFCSSLKTSFIRLLADIAARKIIANFALGWAEGGDVGQGWIEKYILHTDIPFLKFATGGVVPGTYDPFRRDTVLAWLSPGEGIVRREAMQIPGVRELVEKLNKLPKYQEGGEVQVGDAAVQYIEGTNLMLLRDNPQRDWVKKQKQYFPDLRLFIGRPDLIVWCHNDKCYGPRTALEWIDVYFDEHHTLLPNWWAGDNFTHAPIGGTHTWTTYTPNYLKRKKGENFWKSVISRVTGLVGGFADLFQVPAEIFTKVFGKQVGAIFSTAFDALAVALAPEIGIPMATTAAISLGYNLTQGKDFWTALSSAATAALGAGIFSALSDIPTTPEAKGWAYLKGLPGKLWDRIKNVSSSVFDAIENFVSSPWETIKTIWKNLQSEWETFKNNLWDFWGSLKEVPKNMWEWLRNFDPVAFIRFHLMDIMKKITMVPKGGAGNLDLSILTDKFGTYTAVAHTGGLIPAFAGGGEVPVIARPYEYMVRPEAARSVGYDNLDYINRTGQLPQTGPQEIHLNLEIHVDGASEPVVINKVIPVIRDASQSGMAIIHERAIINEGE
ncbi:MAG TPA: hypothetical protein ENG51_20475 [Deltaproteobacteria bacterium]|nr:hypothetical protein [Deltaproteobacteria bacterium]